MKPGVAQAILLSILYFHQVQAQDPYQIKLETKKIMVYSGYVNQVVMSIEPDSSKYVLHAQAEGATIGYDGSGHIEVFPFLPKGVIRLYAEREGRVYMVHGELLFERVTPPENSSGFAKRMGITKEDDRKRIRKPRKFVVPDSLIVDSGLRLKRVDLQELRSDEMNTVVVSVNKRLNGSETVLKGVIQITSKDARISQIEERVFSITPIASLKKCRLTIIFNGKKVDEVSVPVWSPGRE